MLTRQGFEIPHNDFRIKKAKQELLVAAIDRTGIQKYPKQFPVYWDHGFVTVVPRFWAAEKYGTLQADFGPVTPIDVEFDGTLRADLDQPAAMAAVTKSIQNSGGAILSLSTGGGKTVCACWLIAKLRVKTIILVHKDILRTQWAERVQQFLPKAKVSFVQGNTCDLSGDVVVAMIQTIVQRQYQFPGFGLCICDEGHHISAETFSTAMHGLCCPYSLGLTATPERKDGLTRIMHWFLGPSAYVTQRQNMNNVVVELIKYSCARYRQPPPMTRFGTVNYAAVITDIADDTQRTALIVDHVLRLREDPERIVLVLSHRRDHCTEIARRIPGAVTFLGGPKKKNLTQDHTTAPVVCATFALASEGYDDARLNALVLATPCSDITQAAGRILRGTPLKAPVIVDILDDFSVAYAQAAKRKGYYRAAGFTYASQVKKDYPKCIIIDS